MLESSDSEDGRRSLYSVTMYRSSTNVNLQPRNIPRQTSWRALQLINSLMFLMM